MGDYIKEVQKLDTEIDIAMVDYHQTKDTKYLTIASHLNFQLEELRRSYYEGTV